MKSEAEIRDRIEVIKRVGEIIQKCLKEEDLDFDPYIERLVSNYSKVAIDELKWVLEEYDAKKSVKEPIKELDEKIGVLWFLGLLSIFLMFCVTTLVQ